MLNWITAVITVVALMSCASRNATSRCTNTPEDFLTTSQARSLYAIADSLFKGMHLRHCQLYVARIEETAEGPERFSLHPNASHFRTSVHHFIIRGETVELVSTPAVGR